MCVLLNQRPREVGLVLPITHLDTRLHVDEAQLFADTLCLAVSPVVVGNDPHRQAEVGSGGSQLFDEVAGVAGRCRIEVGERVALGLGDVELLPEAVLAEASGGIALSDVHAYAATGVDVISMGSLTHSVPSLDFSFRTGE